MPLENLRIEHQRIAILRLLLEEPGYDLNESMLQDGLDALGLDISRDALRVQLAWLEEVGLINVEKVINSRVATLNARGEDVAKGKVRVPGIKRPRAGD